MEVTRVLASDRPRRKKGFQLLERLEQGKPDSGEERKLEWAIHNRWGPNGEDANHTLWRRLISFQVPVYDNNLHDGWDKIDLVGIDHQGFPVIVELKRGSSTEKPLRPLLEAAGYAIALKKVWPAFRKELEKMLRKTNLAVDVAAEPGAFHLVILAPGEYWQWLEQLKAIRLNAWDQFSLLKENLAKRGYPVSFAEVDPHSLEVAAVDNFPPRE